MLSMLLFNYIALQSLSKYFRYRFHIKSFRFDFSHAFTVFNHNVCQLKASPLPRPVSSPVSSGIKTEKIVAKAESGKSSADLLGLDIGNSDPKLEDDSFGLFVSSTAATDPTDDKSDTKIDSKAKSDEESAFFNQKAPTDDKKVLSKESILSLYSSAPPPPLLSQTQPPVVGAQNSAFNGSNPALFAAQFGTSQPIAGQNSLFMSQTTASIGQTPNLMNQVCAHSPIQTDASD